VGLRARTETIEKKKHVLEAPPLLIYHQIFPLVMVIVVEGTGSCASGVCGVLETKRCKVPRDKESNGGGSAALTAPPPGRFLMMIRYLIHQGRPEDEELLSLIEQEGEGSRGTKSKATIRMR
jgi:hypothetical protein